jgi:hypothetical protein
MLPMLPMLPILLNAVLHAGLQAVLPSTLHLLPSTLHLLPPAALFAGRADRAGHAGRAASA